jgi:hypothetical protein
MYKRRLNSSDFDGERDVFEVEEGEDDSEVEREDDFAEEGENKYCECGKVPKYFCPDCYENFCTKCAHAHSEWCLDIEELKKLK